MPPVVENTNSPLRSWAASRWRAIGGRGTTRARLFLVLSPGMVMIEQSSLTSSHRSRAISFSRAPETSNNRSASPYGSVSVSVAAQNDLISAVVNTLSRLAGAAGRWRVVIGLTATLRWRRQPAEQSRENAVSFSRPCL